MEERYAVFMGKPCVDSYYDIREWPEEGGKFLGSFSHDTTGGMVANAACVYAGYDAPAYLFARMGDSGETRFLMEDMESYGVDVSRMELIPGRKDTKCFIFRNGPERTILVAEGDTDPLPLTDSQKEFLFGAAYLYTIIQDLKTNEVTPEMLKEYRENGGKLVMDLETTGYFPDWRDYAGESWLLFMNSYALEMFGEGKDREELEKEILSGNTEILVEALGSKGCRVVTKEGSFTTGVYQVDVADTTGAGDTFNASFLYALSRGADLKAASLFATAAADIAITEEGARNGGITEERVFRFMDSHEIGEGVE